MSSLLSANQIWFIVGRIGTSPDSSQNKCPVADCCYWNLPNFFMWYQKFSHVGV